MKRRIRRTVFLLLSLWFLLGAAAAEPYTVPKNLAEVSGLPENPEAPAMRTRTDGGTVSISVDGELTALNVCWNRIVFPLTLQDGEAAFTIDKKMVRVGVRGKQNGLKWTLRNPEEESGAEDTLLCSVTPCGAEIQQGFAVLRKTGSGNEYQYYRAESVDVKKPGYYYWVPIDAEISTEVLKTDGEGRPVKIRETQKITCEQRTIESDDRKADRETVQTMKQEMREAAEKLNVEPDPDDWELDTEGSMEITLKAAVNDAEHSGIRTSDTPLTSANAYAPIRSTPLPISMEERFSHLRKAFAPMLTLPFTLISVMQEAYASQGRSGANAESPSAVLD